MQSLKKIAISLLLLLTIPLCASANQTASGKGEARGTCALFLKKERKFIKTLPRAKIFFRFKKREILIMANELGDYYENLEAGVYFLVKVVDENGNSFKFMPSQNKKLVIRKNETSVFNINVSTVRR